MSGKHAKRKLARALAVPPSPPSDPFAMTRLEGEAIRAANRLSNAEAKVNELLAWLRATQAAPPIDRWSAELPGDLARHDPIPWLDDRLR